MLAGRVEAGRGVHARRLSVVPGVEALAAELEVAAFGEQRKALRDRDIPVVDAVAGPGVLAGVAEAALRGAGESGSVEVATEGAFALRNVSVAGGLIGKTADWLCVIAYKILWSFPEQYQI